MTAAALREALDRKTASDAQRHHWANLSARGALAGYQLWRSDAADGHVRYFAAKFGLVRVLRDVAEVERFLELAGVK